MPGDLSKMSSSLRTKWSPEVHLRTVSGFSIIDKALSYLNRYIEVPLVQ